jgi:putative Mg2+ transporter-C (MgtC) family protein
MIAGIVIGFNREERGRAAGFRTTILVGLAASVAMIQTNILLPVSGKTPASFAVMDLMRLPLGILTGVGFIGGGAILKKGRLITGITTAATLWMMTVIGLCLGGGQIILGITATLLGVMTLWVLQWVDVAIPHERTASLTLEAAPERDVLHEIPSRVSAMGYRSKFRKYEIIHGTDRLQYEFELSWRQAGAKADPAGLLNLLGQDCIVTSFELLSEDSH